MDANELSNLLEDVREFMTLVRTGERACITQLTEVARENIAAHSPIGHVIEQYLLKADPALKIGALFCIDSICQQVGEPYVSYFSTNIAQMFLETWKYASASTRDRMRRWIDMYAERQIFPPAVVEQIRHAVDPASLRKAPATASTSASRNDPRKAMKRPGLGAPQAASWGAPRAAPGRPMPPVPSTIHRQAPSVPGTPHPYMQPPGHVMYQRPGVAPPPMYGMPPNTIPPPMPLAPLPQAPLGTSFRGVRLQVDNFYLLRKHFIVRTARLLVFKDPRSESLLFLNEVTRKIKTHLNDKRIARQCAKREGKAAKSRQWCPSADMWLKGTVAVETAAPVQDEEAAKPKHEEPQRFFVIKDDTQTRCAISNEPFEEEWDGELQEWVYVNAVRLPESLSRLPEIDLPPGSIVKVALLDAATCKLLGELDKQTSKKRRGDHLHENGVQTKRAKAGGFNDSDAE